MNFAEQPAAVDVTTELRRYLHIGPRTTRQRIPQERIFEAIENEAQYPGYYHEPLAAALRPAAPIVHAWDKHVAGYRLAGEVTWRLTTLSPWNLTGLIGRMVEDGITNNGEAERWFADHRSEFVA